LKKPNRGVLPTAIAKRLYSWKSLLRWSVFFHGLFGVLGIGASTLAASGIGSASEIPLPKVLSVLAALCMAILGFWRFDRMYARYVGAWRILDIAAMRYLLGKANVDDLLKAVEKGEALVARVEREVDPRVLPGTEAEGR